MEPPACEVCGQPATVNILDLIALPPVADARGREWACWGNGGSHAFCADHVRQPALLGDQRPAEYVAAEPADMLWKRLRQRQELAYEVTQEMAKHGLSSGRF